MNEELTEKWKEDFDSRFTELLLQVDDTAGKDDYCRAAEWVKSFIENLLEQERAERDNFWAKNEESRLKNYEALGYHKGKMAERKRMSDEIEKLKQYNSHIGIGGLHSADMQIVHNDAIDKALSIINK